MGTRRCAKICDRPAVTLHVPNDRAIYLFIRDEDTRTDITSTAVFYIADGALIPPGNDDEGVVIGDVIIPAGFRVWIDGKRISLDLACKFLTAGVVKNLIDTAERIIKQHEDVVVDAQGRI